MGQALSTVTLQSFLDRHGAKLAIDGVAGPETQTALSDFLHRLPELPVAELGPTLASDNFEGLDSPPDYPGGDSGVTIGLGYDLGYESNFEADWSEVLDAEVLERLAKTIGLKGGEAGVAAEHLRDIRITEAQAIGVFNKRTAAVYDAQLDKIYPGWRALLPEAQIAIWSLVYDRGNSLAGGDRIQMRAMVPMVQTGDYVGLANELIAMISIWNGSSIHQDMKTRRTAESDLCLTAYFRTRI